jgi:hypothetical protein
LLDLSVWGSVLESELRGHGRILPDEPQRGELRAAISDVLAEIGEEASR